MDAIRKAAALLMLCNKSAVKNWYDTESETAVSYIVSIISVIFGPMAGSDASRELASPFHGQPEGLNVWELMLNRSVVCCVLCAVCRVLCAVCCDVICCEPLHVCCAADIQYCLGAVCSR